MFHASDQIHIALPRWQAAETSINLAGWPAWLGLRGVPRLNTNGSLQPGSIIELDASILLVRVTLHMRVDEYLPGYYLALQNTHSKLPLTAQLDWEDERGDRTLMRLKLAGSLPALPWPLRPLAELAATVTFQRACIRWLARLRRASERKECQLA